MIEYIKEILFFFFFLGFQFSPKNRGRGEFSERGTKVAKASIYSRGSESEKGTGESGQGGVSSRNGSF